MRPSRVKQYKQILIANFIRAIVAECEQKIKINKYNYLRSDLPEKIAIIAKIMAFDYESRLEIIRD